MREGAEVKEGVVKGMESPGQVRFVGQGGRLPRSIWVPEHSRHLLLKVLTSHPSPSQAT